MPDARFFSRSGSYTLESLSKLTGATLSENADKAFQITDVSPLEGAKSGDICFLDNRKYIEKLATCQASACILAQGNVEKAPSGMALLITENPYKTYAIIAATFYPDIAPESSVHPTAIVHDTAIIGEGTQVSAGVVIEKGVTIGKNCTLEPNVVIGESVQLGDDVKVGANASLSHCIVGSRVYLYPGVRIGQRGFGFAMDATGPTKVPQLGRVIIGDNVEVGANSTIDRGAGPDTVIGDGVMIDNLVQIGHNVQIGSGCVIVAQSGISGSTILENFVALGGQSGVSGHITIGAGAQIGAQSGVMRDVKAGERMLGSPAAPVRQFFRRLSTIERLAKKKGA